MRPNGAALYPQESPSGGVPFVGLVKVYGLEPGTKWVTPTTYDWNLTIERQILPDTLLNVSYVGLRAVHLRQDIDLNPRAAGIGTDASRTIRALTDILGITIPECPTITPFKSYSEAPGRR